MENNSITFTLFQWNTLNKILADKKAFPYVSEEILSWKYREPLIQKIIDDNKGDIICLEEVRNEYFKTDILDKCSVKYDVVFKLRPNKLMGNLIGVNKELFSIESEENIILEEEGGKPGGQNIISVLINDKKTNNKFMVIVVHLKSKDISENTRLYQVIHLMKYIEKNQLGKYPIFILGDFNARPKNTCMLKFFGNKNINAMSLFDLDKLNYTTIKKRDILHKKVIDYIFFIGKNKDDKGNYDKELNILETEIAKVDHINEKIGLPNDIFPSDHLFLKAKVELKFI
jgi:mRNA deadenylase 3'-5' endonuclease subunit Ccr4